MPASTLRTSIIRIKSSVSDFLDALNWYLPQWVCELLLDAEHRRFLKDLRSGAGSGAARPRGDVADIREPRWAFVLLQYNHYELTRECVESIDGLSCRSRPSIVVVDNGSTDGAAEALERLYGERSDIHLIKLEANVGYARGNNSGYRFAKEELEADFIFLANNDIVFPDDCILGLVEKEYRRNAFSILGPDIVAPRAGGLHQNPIRCYFKTEADIARTMRREKERLSALEAGGAARGSPEIHGHRQRSRRREGALVLHGAAFVFSPIFLEAFAVPFDEGTFLYGEEPILALRAFASGHKLVYFPKAAVEHHANASTEMDKSREYWIFRLRNGLQSASVYLSTLRRALAEKDSA